MAKQVITITITDCTSEYIQAQQEQKSRYAISLTRSIH